MHAFILINSNAREFAKKQNAKVIPFTLQKIEDARELKNFVKFVFNEKTAILIENIDSATPEATNAFLKNLEEPNKNLIYILTASNLENVLPTIASRCQVIQVSKACHSVVKQVLQDKHINIKNALNIKDRNEAIKFVEDLIYLDHKDQNFKNMENYLGTIRNLKLNGNVSLQMTNLLVTMNRDGQTAI